MKSIKEVFQVIETPAIAKKLFIELEGRAVRYEELSRQSRQLTTHFQALQLQEGDRIFLVLNESWETLLLFLTALRCGIAPVMINPETGPLRFRSLQEIAAPKAIFFEPGLEEKYKLGGGQHLPVYPQEKPKGKLFKKLLKRKAETAEGPIPFLDHLASLPAGEFPEEVMPDTTAYVLFTSGSTGLPKGVEISHQALLTHLATLCRVYEIDQHSVLLNILRWHQADGLLHGAVLALFAQAATYRPFTFEMSKIGLLLASIYKFRITHFIAVPTLLNFLYQFGAEYPESFETEDFKCLVSTAARLDIKLWTQFEQRFKVQITNCYGLSETVAGALFAAPSQGTHKIGSLGKPVDCEARLVDDAGQPVPVGTTGELLLKGPHLLKGYLHQPELTQAALKEGWFYTGDLAYQDEAGYFFLNGRKKELIISGGVNIHPQEVAELINLHDAVLESACIGLEDPVFDERLVAAVALKPGARLAAHELIDYCRQQLESAKVPHAVYFFQSLPKTVSGKVDAPALVQAIRSQASGLQDEHHQSLMQDILAVAAEAFKIAPGQISPEDTPQTLDGWDSMNHLQFIVLLEEKFKVRLSTAEIMSIESLQSAEQVLMQKR